MSLGNNLQYLRRLRKNMTQETLAEQLGVSRQTISKWEMNAALPEMDKAIALCKIFNCSLDSLFREEMDKQSDAYSNLRIEEVEGFQYVEYTVISAEPESDACGRVPGGDPIPERLDPSPRGPKIRPFWPGTPSLPPREIFSPRGIPGRAEQRAETGRRGGRRPERPQAGRNARKGAESWQERSGPWT